MKRRMIITKYPEHIEAQLKQIDDQIANIYEQELSKGCTVEMNARNIERIKRNLYERIKPLLDEKARLIESSCPIYIVKGELK